MGLLQDPIASIEQATWYLENKEHEKFPGAFELAAGNLCRQTLEQILFILCFYSTMPSNRFLRENRTLHTAGRLYRELLKTKSNTNKPYIEIARIRSNRIRKFAKKPRSLNKWVRILNETSHFSTKNRRVNEQTLNNFIDFTTELFDYKDKYLIVAALNEIYSHGKTKATIGNDNENTPGIIFQSVVSCKNIEKSPNGGIALIGPSHNFHVLPSTEVPRGRWPSVPVIVQHSVGIALCIQFVKKDKTPVNISSNDGIFESFSTTEKETTALIRHLRKIGFIVVEK